MVLKTLSRPNGFQNLVILLTLITGIHTASASSSGFFGKGNSPGYFTHASLTLTAAPQSAAPPKRESVPVSQASVRSSSAVIPAEPSHPCQIDPSKMGLLTHDIYGVGVSLVPTQDGDIYGLTGEIRLYRELWIQVTKDKSLTTRRNFTRPEEDCITTL